MELSMEQKLALWLNAKNAKNNSREPKAVPAKPTVPLRRANKENWAGATAHGATARKARVRAKSHGPKTPKHQENCRARAEKQAARCSGGDGAATAGAEGGHDDDGDFGELYWEARFRKAQQAHNTVQEKMQSIVEDHAQRERVLQQQVEAAEARAREAEARASQREAEVDARLEAMSRDALAAQHVVQPGAGDEAKEHGETGADCPELGEQRQASTAGDAPAAGGEEAEGSAAELERVTQQNATMRFLNEVLAQEVTDVKRRARKKRVKLQRLHERAVERLQAEREKAEEQVGAQIEVMTSKLKAGLQKSMVKIRSLEAALAEERARNGSEQGGDSHGVTA